MSVLKREPSVIFKAKSNPSVYVLATQLLLLALQHSYDWPETIGKVSRIIHSHPRYIGTSLICYKAKYLLSTNHFEIHRNL